MNKQPIEIRWHWQANEITPEDSARSHYDAGYADGAKHAAVAVSIICGSLFLIAVAAFFGF